MTFIIYVFTTVVLSDFVCLVWVIKWTWLKENGTLFAGQHPTIAVNIQRFAILAIATMCGMVGIAGALYFSQTQLTFGNLVIWG